MLMDWASSQRYGFSLSFPYRFADGNLPAACWAMGAKAETAAKRARRRTARIIVASLTQNTVL